MARQSTQKTTVLPIAEKMYDLAKSKPEFRQQYFAQALRLGECDSIEQVKIKFNDSDNVYVFLRDCGVIGDNK